VRQSKVILLHGKDKDSSFIWYPWLKQELANKGIQCDIPDLPQADNPKINEWLSVIDSLKPDADTTLVGHSRGGMAILRWVESRQQHVRRVILVAANSATITDDNTSDFYSGLYDFATIRDCCDEFVVMHSKDDEWVPYAAGLENTEGLNARLISFENRAHFGKQADGTMMTTFPELLNEISGSSVER